MVEKEFVINNETGYMLDQPNLQVIAPINRRLSHQGNKSGMVSVVNTSTCVLWNPIYCGIVGPDEVEAMNDITRLIESNFQDD